LAAAVQIAPLPQERRLQEARSQPLAAQPQRSPIRKARRRVRRR
jgi:hypothetical protein